MADRLYTRVSRPARAATPPVAEKGQPTPNETFMKEAARLVKIKRGDTVGTISKFEAIVRRMLQSLTRGNSATPCCPSHTIWMWVFSAADLEPDPKAFWR